MFKNQCNCGLLILDFSRTMKLESTLNNTQTIDTLILDSNCIMEISSDDKGELHFEINHNKEGQFCNLIYTKAYIISHFTNQITKLCSLSGHNM